MDDEPNFNIHGIDDIPIDLDTQDKGNKKFSLAFNVRKERNEFKSLVNI